MCKLTTEKQSYRTEKDDLYILWILFLRDLKKYILNLKIATNLHIYFCFTGNGKQHVRYKQCLAAI